MSTLTETLALLITGDAGGAVRAFAQTEVAAKGAAGSATTAGSALAKFGLSGGAGALAAGTAATAAGLAVVKFGEDTIHSFTSAADGVRRYRAVAGGTAEDASRMVAAFDALGIPVDQASSALFKMGANIEANSAKLREHGVVIATDANGNVDLNKTLLNTVAAYRASASAADRDFIAKTAMGKGAQALIPLLSADTEELKKFGDAAAARGEIFSDKDLESARQFGITMREGKADAKALGVQIGRAITPEITDIVKGADHLLKDFDGLTKSVGGLGGIFKTIVSFTPAGTLAEIGKHSKSTATDTVSLADAIKQRTQAEQDATTAADADTQKLEGLVGALQSERSAENGVTEARKAVAAAQAESLKKTQDEAAAVEQMRRADESLAQAERDLNEAKREAPENRAKAELDEEQATLDLVDAEKAYTVAIEKYGQTSEEAQKADINRQRARFAKDDAAAKAKELADAGNRPQSVLDAEQRVAAAKQAQATAAQAKTKADQEDPVADLAKAEADLKVKTDGELMTRLKLKKTLDDFNTEFGKTLTMADLLNGKADQLLTTLLKSKAEETTGVLTMAGPGSAGFGLTAGGGAFGGKGASGSFGPAAPQPVIQIGPVYNNDPDEIARSVAFAFRAR